MEIKKTFNTTIKEIESKKFNILLPICVGNRFFLDNTSPPENISKYLEWALKNIDFKAKYIIAIKEQIKYLKAIN